MSRRTGSDGIFGTRWKDICKNLLRKDVDNVDNGEENFRISVIINRIMKKMSKKAVFYRIFPKQGYQIM